VVGLVYRAIAVLVANQITHKGRKLALNWGVKNLKVRIL